MDVLLSIVLAVVCTPLTIFIALQIYSIYLGYSTRIDSPNGISSLEEIEIGGVKQWIFIRGRDLSNPILLFLHGGPGEPVMGMSSSRKYDTILINHFTMVHWDQRGAGKSFNTDISPDTMTFNRLVEDCNELIDHLRSRFSTEKVFLVAYSGGTTIGIMTAHRYPEKIHAYVGVAQIINDFEQQRISYNYLLDQAEKSGDVKTQIAIKEIGPPVYETPRKELEKAKYIDRYGGFMHSGSIIQMLGIMWNYLTSPEYSLLDGYRTMRGKGFHFTLNALWKEITQIDFFKDIRSLKIPTYFLMGKYDMITPTELVENFYIDLVAERGKSLVIFEDSAHFLMMEEKEKYQDFLIDVVLKECRKSN